MSTQTRLCALVVACLLIPSSWQVISAQQPASQTVDYPAGWNLVGAPSFAPFSEAVGPLYSLSDDGTSYEITPAATHLPAGEGYWAYLSQPVEKMFVSNNSQPIILNLSPGIFRMIGNPFLSPAVVTGVDFLIVYDPVQGYQETDMIPVGRGAFAYSAMGGTLTISDSP